MQIQLNKFEQYLDKTILKRGLLYFSNGHVHEPEEVRPGEYEVIVEGSENYTVRLTLKDEFITNYDCDCPYDMGGACKHVVAVFYYLRQDELNLNKKKSKNGKTVKPVKQKTIAHQINELLEKTSYEELKQFVREKTTGNTQFRNLFLSSFAHHNSHESKELYAKQVKSILRTVKDRHGFIDWSASRFVGKEAANLLESARKQIDSLNYQSAFFICTAVMEQMTQAIQYADDSNGDIGGIVDSAYEMLYEMTQKRVSELLRKQLLEYCFTAFEKGIFSGWDWHIGMLDIALLLLKTEEETEYILTLINKAQNSASEYQKEKLQTFLYHILLKTKGENTAEEYLEQNITNTSLRKIAIEKALENKNYQKAISTAQDGIVCDQKERPGFVSEWYDWLVKISLAQNNKEKIIEYARWMLLYNFRHKQDYYGILKQHVNPENWKAFIEEVIKDITQKKHWDVERMLADIFIKEEWWDRLFGLVKKSPNLNTIEEYEKYLSKNYAPEIVQFYSEALIEYMKKNMGRDHYQNAVKYIRKIIKLGAKDKADQIISYLKVEYPKRKALMEELGKI